MQRKVTGSRSIRARSGAALARSRELSSSGQRSDGWLTLNGERTRDEVSRDVVKRDRDTTRAAVSARTSRAPAASSTRAHASTVAPVVLTSSINTTLNPSTLAPLRIAKRHAHSHGARRREGRSATRWPGSVSARRSPSIGRCLAISACLIETPLHVFSTDEAERVPPHRRLRTGRRRHVPSVRKRARQGSMTGIFQRVDDLAKRAVVIANGAA